MILASRQRLFLSCAVVCLLLVESPLVQANDPELLLESCRGDGFDPWQLSCETCAFLPADHKPRCLECCQSYKTSERMTKPYESAVLVHRPVSGGDSEMEQFLNEHWDDLVKTKGSKRLIKMEQNHAASSSRFMFMRLPSQMLLWFDEVVEPGQKLKFYKDTAKETVLLDGYKKDDMKDMLTTLLPAKK
jgi:hypothetical protein